LRSMAMAWKAAASVPEYEVKRLLAAAGVPVTREQLAISASQAVTAATEIGFPVALKIQSADIAHKARHGGVVLDLADAAEVEQAFLAMDTSVRQALPDASVDGILVQEMVHPGAEL